MPKNSEQENLVHSVATYLEKIKEKNSNAKYIFRGQSDASWEIESTYQRRIEKSDNKNNDFSRISFIEYHKETLIKPFKAYRYSEDKDLTDLQILQELQHYGAATGLIDFSLDCLVALWFACNGNRTLGDKKNGKVFLFDIKPTEIKTNKDLDLELDDIDDKTINIEDGKVLLSDLIQKGIKTNKDLQWIKIDDNDIFFIEEKYKSNNRISSQNGVFLLSINPIQKYDDIEIDAEYKEQILNELKTNFHISEETLFQDVFGFASMNNVHHPIITKSAQSYFDDGNEYLKEGKYEEGYTNRGNAYKDLGNYDKAITNYNKALETNPNSYEVYYNRGNAYKYLKEYDKAIADYNKALEINPNSYEVYNNRGVAYKYLKEYDKALADYNKALEINPNSYQVYSNRGIAYKELKDYDKALADYDKALEINPDYLDAYNNRGDAHTRLEQYDEAIEDFKEALEIERKNYGADYKNGAVYTRLEQNVENMENNATQKPELKTPKYKKFVKNLKDLLKL